MKLEIGLYVGTIKKDATDNLKELEGMELFLINSLFNKNEFIIGNPLTLENLQKYYNSMFQNGGKEYIHENYNDFLKYMLNEDCEIITSTSKENFVNVRKFSKTDDSQAHNALIEFKKINNIK